MGRVSSLVVAVVVASSPGCGGMMLRGHDVDAPRPWPLVSDASNEAKPTLLIRMPDGPVATVDRKKDTYTPSDFRAAIDCGLFSTVAYEHPGLKTDNVKTDYTLDLSISHDLKLRWYTYIGVFTLGAIPVSCPDVYTVSAVLYDSDHKELAKFAEEDHVQYVLWLPLLPADVAFTSILPWGEYLGLDVREWDPDTRATIEDLLGTILAKANNEVHFTAARPAVQAR